MRVRPGVITRACVAPAAALLLLCVLPPIAAAQSPSEPQEQPEGIPETREPVLIRAFGAVEWDATQEPDVPNSFALGQFSLFLTSNLSERISVLAEIVLEGSTGTRVVTDLERLQLTFRLDDHLQVTAGRFHTGVGFYNAAFHHGAFFETLIGRPRVYRFEDEGGVLPVHDVGVSVRGAVPGTGLALRYLAEIGNGRTWESTQEHETLDNNAAKAVNVGLTYRVPRMGGLEIGASYYRDTLVDPSALGIAHTIGVAYAVYRTPAAEVMVEWLRLTHDTGGGYTTDAGYAQLSKTFGSFKPYYRYDRLAVAPGTPFIGPLGSYKGHTIGLRFDPAAWLGLKAQYERTDEAELRGIDAVRTQLVFVF